MLRLLRVPLVWCALALAAAGCSRDTADSTGPAEPAVEAAPATSDERFVSVFVRYKTDAPQNRMDVARGRGARFAYDVARHRWLVLTMPRGAVHSLDNIPWIDSVEVDTSVTQLAGDVYPWGIDSTGADLVHSYAKGTGVKIAYLDGGSRCTYTDLSTRIVGGYDFVGSSSTYCQNTMSSTSSLDHGTAVAQVLAASINGVNFVGMAPEASLYNLRVCYSPPAGAPTDCPTAYITAALDWALTNGMQVTSASLANCMNQAPPALVNQLMNDLHAANVVQVWAGGNGTWTCDNTSIHSGWIDNPHVIAVTAYSKNSGYVSEFAHHSYLDIAAPTDVERQSIFGWPTCCFSGTSASTPHVAGAAALLIGLGFTGADLIRQRLIETAEDRGTAGYDIYYGAGILRADLAAKRKPSVASVNGAPQPIQVAGTYPLSISIANGVAPFQVAWTVHYSNGKLPDVSTGYGANALNLDVPGGSYTITVRATPKEVTYLRVGTAYQIDYPVCTEGGGGGGDLAAGMQTAGGIVGGGTGSGGGITPNAVGGCTP